MSCTYKAACRFYDCFSSLDDLRRVTSSWSPIRSSSQAVFPHSVTADNKLPKFMKTMLESMQVSCRILSMEGGCQVTIYNRPGWGIIHLDYGSLTSCNGEGHEWRANEDRNNLGDGYTKSTLLGSLPRASRTQILPIPLKQTWGARSPDFLALSLTISSGLNTLSQQLLPAYGEQGD